MSHFGGFEAEEKYMWQIFRSQFMVSGVLIGFLASGAMAQVSFTRYRALGDSLSHGTQGGLIVDYRTQPRAWPVRLASKMGTSFPLPLLDKATLIAGMRRQDYPNYQNCANFACNGASTDDMIQKTCKEIPWIQFGYDWAFENVVLAPRYGKSQVSATVADNATFVTLFPGGNEFLQSILRYGTVLSLAGIIEEQPLGSEAPTSQENFRYWMEQCLTQLYAPGRGMCVGTFPTLGYIAGVLDKDELTGIIGPNPLPEGCYTNEILMAAIIRGWLPSWNTDLLTDDKNYYTPAELAEINNAVIGYNATIRELAASPSHPCAVADLEAWVEQIGSGQVHINGWRITDQYTINNLGKPWASVYSSDGCHPSDIGHALIAEVFIEAINAYYGTNIPHFTEAELIDILNNDRFADNDGDGKIEGIDADAFYYCVNWYLGSTYSGDSGETPRSAKILTVDTANPAMVSMSPAGPEYFTGTTVTVTGLTNGNRRFDHWEGDVPGGYSTENPITIVMDSNKQIVAVFSCASGAMAPLGLMAALMLACIGYKRYSR